MQPKQMKQGTKITLPTPDDFHHHFRQGEDILKAITVHTNFRNHRVLAMPNLQPPVTTVPLALAYEAQLYGSLNLPVPESSNSEDFKFMMTLYLTDDTKPSEVTAAFDQSNGRIVGVKYYPAGATTNSHAGVTDVKKVYEVIREIQRLGMMLCVHSEVPRIDVDIFDREKVFIDEIIKPLVRDFPTLKIVMEHISTKNGVDYVLNEAPDRVVGSITPHHMLYNRNSLLVGGIKPHLYCLPILKREIHRVALLEAAAGESGRFIMGTDSAPHDTEKKEAACGCAGCFVAHASIELYVEAFESIGKIDALESFILAGGKHYGLTEEHRGVITLEKKAWVVPKMYKFGDGEVTPLRAGEEVLWSIVGRED